MMAPLLFCVAALSVVGWGSVLARLMRLSPNNGERGILGLMAIGVTAIVIHFFLPVSIGVQATMLAFGLAALLVHRFDAGWKGAGLFSLACISVLMHDHLLLSSDNGIYHMQTFLWNSGAPLTPGVANLNASFGFNSLLFLIAPVVDRIQFGWITNALAAAFVLSAMLERLRAERRNLSPGAFWFLAGVIAVFVWNAVWLGWFGVLNADGVAAALAVYCVYLWFEYLHGMRKDLAPSLLALVTTFALAVKLSALALIPAGIVVWLLSRGPRPSYRVLVFSVVTGLLLMARGALLSGCIVFPIPQTCVYRLPWTVYPEWTKSYSTGIRSWARSPGRKDYAVVLASWDWLSPWYERNRDLYPLFRALRWTVPIGLAALLLVLLKRIRREAPLLYVAALLVCCVGWWFWAAPDPRFGAGFLASISIVSLGLALSWVRLTPAARSVTFSVLTGTLAVSAAYGATQRSDGWVPSIPVPPVKLVTGPKGITIKVTTDGSMCWDQPIPCVPDTAEDQKAFQKVRWRRLPPFQSSGEKFTVTIDEHKWPTRVDVHRGPHAGQSYTISDSNSRLFRSDFDGLAGLHVNNYSEVGGLTIALRGLAEDDVASQYQSGDARDHIATEYSSPLQNRTRLLFFAWVRAQNEHPLPALWLQDKNGFISQAEVGFRGPDGWVLLVGQAESKKAEQVRLVVMQSVGAISLIDKMLLVGAPEE